MAIRTKSVRSRTYLLLVLSIVLLPRCAIRLGDGGESEEGCGGSSTVGKQGRLAFYFEGASSNEDLSRVVFAAGTTARFRVTLREQDELPRLNAFSTRPAVFSVTERPDDDGLYELSFRASGTATLQLVPTGQQDPFDELDLRVAEAAWLRLSFPGLFEAPDHPTRIYSPAGTLLKVGAQLVDAQGDNLWGRFEPQVQGQGLTEVLNASGDLRCPVVELQTTGEGTELLSIEGPDGLSADIELVVAPSPDATGLQLSNLWEPEEDDVRVGDSIFLVASFLLPSDHLALGYPISLTSSKPQAIRIAAELMEGGAMFLVSFLAEGEVTLYATLDTDPTILGQMTLQIGPPRAEPGQ